MTKKERMELIEKGAELLKILEDVDCYDERKNQGILWGFKEKILKKNKKFEKLKKFNLVCYGNTFNELRVNVISVLERLHDWCEYYERTGGSLFEKH